MPKAKPRGAFELLLEGATVMAPRSSNTRTNDTPRTTEKERGFYFVRRHESRRNQAPAKVNRHSATITEPGSHCPGAWRIPAFARPAEIGGMPASTGTIPVAMKTMFACLRVVSVAVLVAPEAQALPRAKRRPPVAFKARSAKAKSIKLAKSTGELELAVAAPKASFWLATDPHVPLAVVNGDAIHSVGKRGKECGDTETAGRVLRASGRPWMRGASLRAPVSSCTPSSGMSRAATRQTSSPPAARPAWGSMCPRTRPTVPAPPHGLSLVF